MISAYDKTEVVVFELLVLNLSDDVTDHLEPLNLLLQEVTVEDPQCRVNIKLFYQLKIFSNVTK